MPSGRHGTQHAPPPNLRRMIVIVPNGERFCLSASTGDTDCAGVRHEIGGLGHVQAGRAQEQQHSGGDDSKVDAIHGPPR